MHLNTLPLALLAGAAVALPTDNMWDPWALSSTTTSTTSTSTTSSAQWDPWTQTSSSANSTVTTTKKSSTKWHGWYSTNSTTKTATSTKTIANWANWQPSSDPDQSWGSWGSSDQQGSDSTSGDSASGSGSSGSANGWGYSSGSGYTLGSDSTSWSSASGSGSDTGSSNSGSGSWSSGSNGVSGSNSGSWSSGSSSGSGAGSSSGNRAGSATWSGAGTPVEQGPLDDWFRQGPKSGAVPTATLLPNIHWSQDLSDTDNVKPCDSRQQYYVPEGADSNTPHQYGWLTTNFTNNAIVLDHSNLYTFVYTASSGDLTITFQDRSTYNLAQGTWHTGMIMVFYDGTCGDAMNCYSICKSLTFDSVSGTCQMSTSSARFEDIMSYFTFEWGHYVPGRRNGGGSIGGSSIGGTNGNSTGSNSNGDSGSSTKGSSGSGSGVSTSTDTGSTTGTLGTATTSGTLTTSTAVSNYSLGYDGDNDNCTAPVDTVYGLPTACLGQYFDQDLDDSYDYVDISQTDFAQVLDLYPNVWYTDATASSDDLSDDTSDDAALGLSKRGLARRWWNPISALKSVVKTVVSVLPPIPGITRPYDIPLIDKTIPLNIPSQRQTVATPKWGQQVLIKSLEKKSASGALSGKVDLYCVDCGASGSANIAGKIGVSALGGVDYVKADLNMNLAIGLKIGLIADVEYKQTFSQPLFTVPLSPLTIGVASIGPYLKAGAELDLNLVAKGSVLGGGSMTFSNSKISIDVTSFSGSASGWTPSFDPVFEAEGEISAQADFGLPIAVALGITALSYSADVSLVERPGVVAKAQASASASLAGAGFVTVDGCTGISAGLDFKNDVYAQFTLPGKDPKKYPLFPSYQKALYSHCIALPAAPSATTSASSTDTASTDNTNTDGSDTATATDNTATATATGDDTSSAAATPTGDDNGSAATTTGGDDNNAATTSSPEETAIRKRSVHKRFEKRSTSQVSTTSTAQATTSTASAGAAATTGSPTATGTTSASSSTSTTSSESGDFVDTTSSTLSTDGKTNDTAFVVPDSNDLDFNRTDGYYISTLVDSTARFQAYPCSNGNIHVFGVNDTNIKASDCQEDFTMYQTEDVGNVVLADGFARVFVYYPDEMTKTGVSRIRVVDVENIPTGAEEILWVPDDSTDSDGSTIPVYYPVDTQDNTYYPAMCHYTTNVPNKMFLMKDPSAGLSILKDANIKYSITGGDIDSCYYLPLVDGSGYDAAGDNGGLFTDYDENDGSDDGTSAATTSASSPSVAPTTTSGTTATATSANPSAITTD